MGLRAGASRGATLGEAFARALIDAMPTPQARTMCVMVLSRWAGRSIYLPAADRGERRRQAAGNMLANGMSPADAALALHQRFGVSLRQGQRDVASCDTSPRQMSWAGVAVGSEDGGLFSFRKLRKFLKSIFHFLDPSLFIR